MKALHLLHSYFPEYKELLLKNEWLQNNIRPSDVTKLFYRLKVNPTPFYKDIEVRAPVYEPILREFGEKHPVLLKKFNYPEMSEHYVLKPVPNSFFYQKNYRELNHLTSYRNEDHATYLLDKYPDSIFQACPTWGIDRHSIILNTQPTEDVFLYIQVSDWSVGETVFMNNTLAFASLTMPILYFGLEYLNPTINPYLGYYPLILDILAQQDLLPNVHLKSLNLTPSQEYIVNRSSLNYIIWCINDEESLATHLSLDPILNNEPVWKAKIESLGKKHHYLR